MFRSVVSYKGAPGVTIPMIRRAMKQARKDMVVYWHRNILPRHFLLDAVGKYGYTPRTAPYMRRKGKKKGHQFPLVYSGTGRDTATRAFFGLSGTPKTARLKFRVPFYMGIVTRTRIDMIYELTATLPSEIEEMEVVLDANIQQALAASAQIQTEVIV